MNIIESVKEILVQQNFYEKESQLEQLSDVFEYVQELGEEDVAKGVQLLLAAALQEEDLNMKETFFHTINNAVVYQHIGSRINWDKLVDSLPSLEKEHLDYALNMLGLSVQRKYLPVLKKYSHSSDSEIRKWGQESVDELEYRLAHASESHKEAV